MVRSILRCAFFGLFPPAIPKATQSVKLMGKNHSCLKNIGTAKVILDQILSDYPEHTHAFPN